MLRPAISRWPLNGGSLPGGVVSSAVACIQFGRHRATVAGCANIVAASQPSAAATASDDIQIQAEFTIPLLIVKARVLAQQSSANQILRTMNPFGVPGLDR